VVANHKAEADPPASPQANANRVIAANNVNKRSHKPGRLSFPYKGSYFSNALVCAEISETAAPAHGNFAPSPLWLNR